MRSELDFKHNIGFNKEYCVIAIISSLLCFIFDVAISVFIFTRQSFTGLWTMILTIAIICSCFLMLGICVFFIRKTLNNSNISTMFKKFHEKFTKDYISKAVELHILTKDEAEMCLEIERNKSNNDRKV